MTCRPTAAGKNRISSASPEKTDPCTSHQEEGGENISKKGDPGCFFNSPALSSTQNYYRGEPKNHGKQKNPQLWNLSPPDPKSLVDYFDWRNGVWCCRPEWSGTGGDSLKKTPFLAFLTKKLFQKKLNCFWEPLDDFESLFFLLLSFVRRERAFTIERSEIAQTASEWKGEDEDEARTKKGKKKFIFFATTSERESAVKERKKRSRRVTQRENEDGEKAICDHNPTTQV